MNIDTSHNFHIIKSQWQSVSWSPMVTWSSPRSLCVHVWANKDVHRPLLSSSACASMFERSAEQWVIHMKQFCKYIQTIQISELACFTQWIWNASFDLPPYMYGLTSLCNDYWYLYIYETWLRECVHFKHANGKRDKAWKWHW